MTRVAVVGGLVLLCLPSGVVGAGRRAQLRPVTHIASVAAGSIQGTVQDERGAPVAGATVSALGATTAFAVSDRAGRFEMRTLSPGPVPAARASQPGSSRRADRWSTSARVRAHPPSIALRQCRRGDRRRRHTRCWRAGLGAVRESAPARRRPAATAAATRPETTITASSRGDCATRAAAS